MDVAGTAVDSTSTHAKSVALVLDVNCSSSCWSILQRRKARAMPADTKGKSCGLTELIDAVSRTRKESPVCKFFVRMNKTFLLAQSDLHYTGTCRAVFPNGFISDRRISFSLVGRISPLGAAKYAPAGAGLVLESLYE